MITYRVHGWWMGPIITQWDTSTEEEFEKYCDKWGFEKCEDGVYRDGVSSNSRQSWIEIKQEDT